MSAPTGFTFEPRRSGEVVIRHHGRVAAVLRGKKAATFLADVEVGDGQERMAKLTGNYRRGNERAASDHPRNRRARR